MTKESSVPILAHSESREFWNIACRIKKCRQPPTENGKIKHTDVVIFPDGNIVETGGYRLSRYHSMEEFLKSCDRLSAHLYFVDDDSVTSPPFTDSDVEQAGKATEISSQIHLLCPCPRCATKETMGGSSLVRRPGGLWERLCQACFEVEMRGREPR